MSIRITSIEELAEKIDVDIQWRKKEIADIRIYAQDLGNPPVMLRGAFILCCAHFEGAIKYASNAYIAYISSQEIKGKDLRVEIASVAVRKKKHQSFANPQTKKVKISVVSDVLKSFDEMLEENFYIKLSEDDLIPEIDENDLPLPTEGNPSPEVLFEISSILDIDYEQLFQLREPFINFNLLKPRHSVVHGEKRPISVEELNSVSEFVLGIMDSYKDSILEAARNNKHLRVSVQQE